jgi:hypothetical protein
MTINSEALQTAAAAIRSNSDGNASPSEKSFPDDGYPGHGSVPALNALPKA